MGGCTPSFREQRPDSGDDEEGPGPATRRVPPGVRSGTAPNDMVAYSGRVALDLGLSASTVRR